MLEKIISGGQTGADQAALDAAIKLGIPHGGWIPKGRLTEDGPLPAKYQLREMPTGSYPERTKKNIREADGTLIFSHGPLTGGSEFTRKMAVKYMKPLLHIDFYKMIPFDAAVTINNWMVDHDIRILNVAGPRSSSDPKIYRSVMDIIEAVSFLNLSENNPMQTGTSVENPAGNEDPPRDVSTAVDLIIGGMTLKDRAAMANLTIGELVPLQLNLGMYIRQRLASWSSSDAFNRSCREAAFEEGLDAANTPMVIIRKTWRKLKATHRLRVIK
ncbi:MAG: putative molybdenum carrier protein [Deltaproteobacteria bacterium]|nr:putative molybdenum carrier protein [Deltaproteobacteria bacterium]